MSFRMPGQPKKTSRRRRSYAIALSALVMVLALSPLPAGRSLRAAYAAGLPTVEVTTSSALVPVPAEYLGFSVEPANVCYIAQLAQGDPAFLQLFENLGLGTVRVGGGTGDKQATWSTSGPASCVYRALVMTPAEVDSFFTAFVQPIGYSVTWQVPLYNPANLASDASEAAYVSAQPGVKSIEIGNEPNLYPNVDTDYQTYINQWNTVYQDYLTDGGTAPVSGPGVAKSGFAPYITDFLAQNASRLSAVSAHFYDGDANNPSATCQNLLAISQLQSYVAANVALAKSYHLPFIMGETNTYTHGAPGVSDAFCSALWAADYALFALQEGAQNIDFHGVADYPAGNVGGKLEYYSPIWDDGTPAPEYYGLLFFHEMTQAGGQVVAASVSNAPNLDTYGVIGADGKLRVALINRSGSHYTLTVQTDQSYTNASELTLTAPALNATSGVTFGGTAVASNGTWTPTPTPLPVSGTSLTATVPAHTAVVLTYSSS